MELIKELGRRIQKARKEKGLTQQELADLSHVSLKHVQGCERGVKNPSFEVLRAFGKVLNLSLDSLIANSHFLRTAGPHFPDNPGHIKRTALETSRTERRLRPANQY